MKKRSKQQKKSTKIRNWDLGDVASSTYEKVESKKEPETSPWTRFDTKVTGFTIDGRPAIMIWD